MFSLDISSAPNLHHRRILQYSSDGARNNDSGPNSGIIILVFFIHVAIIGIIVAICCNCVRKMKQASSDLHTLVSSRPPGVPFYTWNVPIDGATMDKFFEELAKEKPVRFSAEQLWNFTNNYSIRLGSGGYGIVYKGEFPNGVKIAVKVLNRNSEKAAEEQFMAEVATIGRTYHVNLVRLYGYCYDPSMSALVYEYMENGSLDKYLFSDTCTIEWEKLHEIAIGTAKGIAYLHHLCAQKIIHYGIKPGNVLLDQSFSPKVADFGLAKLYNHENTHASVTGYRGTPGYSAPEFLLKNYSITYKCDVYSFGMMLFEIVGRRRNTKSSPTDSMDWLPKNVWDEYEKGNLEMMAENLGIEEKDRKKAERAAMVALWCVQDSPEVRPPMSAVVRMLEGEVEIMPPPKPFRYLFSIANDALNDGSDFSNSEGSSSYWYKDDTPIMAKYEIKLASDSTHSVNTD